MERWQNRLTEYPCFHDFFTRHSTRAFDPQNKVTKNDLFSCFEAAKWAPSCSNSQPWRYLYAEIGSHSYQGMLESMVEFNQNWAKNAQYLILICSRKQSVKRETALRTHSFDAGLSCIQFILEAHKRNIACHVMDGFSHEKIRAFFNIPDIYHIEALVACGHKGDISLLSKELQEREVPSLRMNIEDFVAMDTFRFL